MKRKELLIVLIALVAGAFFAGCNKSPAEKKTVEKNGAAPAAAAQVVMISPAELNKMKGEPDVVLVDVREPGELKGEIGAIEGVVNIPVGQIESRLSELDKNKRIVTICRSGRRSAKAADILLKNGFTKVYSLEGGMQAYRNK